MAEIQGYSGECNSPPLPINKPLSGIQINGEILITTDLSVAHFKMSD